MRLTGNKKDISYGNISKRIYWKEDNIRYSDINIWTKQYMLIHSLIQSDYLIHDIYNDINRE
jgi:hypothetical protein